MNLELDRIPSPLGEIQLVVDGSDLVALDYGDYNTRMMKLLCRRYGSVEFVPVSDPHGYSSMVRAYLGGDFKALDGIRVVTGGTPFQEEVWHALRDIPAGTTVTYGKFAARLGRPTSARAVGTTNGQNPVAIVLPCHRVIGANAALTGYAGGLERKAWLLAHERTM